jgi:hypothetical protein
MRIVNCLINLVMVVVVLVLYWTVIYVQVLVRVPLEELILC